jgi:ATP-dependent exoDNAse (exonuclease V) beta subunit
METRLASGRVDNTFLARKNAHERDSRIVFDEEPHLYYIDGSTEGYVSVTTYVHSHFESFDADRIIANMMKSKRWESNEKYYGKTPEQIKKEWQDNCDKAAADGTRMHFVIESFYNEKYNPDSMLHNIDPLYDYDDDEKDDDDVEEESEQVIDELDREELGIPQRRDDNGHGQSSSSSVSLNGSSIEFSYFLNFLHDHPNLIPYRTEWTVFHEELKLAGSIDMLFFDESTNKFHIYDWKRCRNIQKSNPFDKWGNKECINHFPDTNFWHYSLQLNIYKAILERKYNMTIDGLFLVCLHPNNKNSNYIKLKAPNLQEEVSDLFALRSLDLEIHI